MNRQKELTVKNRRQSGARRNHISVYRENGFFVVHNYLTDTKRYYARASDVKAVLRRA